MLRYSFNNVSSKSYALTVGKSMHPSSDPDAPDYPNHFKMRIHIDKFLYYNVLASGLNRLAGDILTFDISWLAGYNHTNINLSTNWTVLCDLAYDIGHHTCQIFQNNLRYLDIYNDNRINAFPIKIQSFLVNKDYIEFDLIWTSATTSITFLIKSETAQFYVELLDFEYVDSYYNIEPSFKNTNSIRLTHDIAEKKLTKNSIFSSYLYKYNMKGGYVYA